MPHIPRVLLLVPDMPGHAMYMMLGASRYAMENGPWDFREAEQIAREPRTLRRLVRECDGILTAIGPPDDPRLRYVLRQSRPHVHMGALPGSDRPQVLPDDEAICRLAFEHLRECGFKRFAVAAHTRHAYVIERARLFAAEAEEAGADVTVLESKHNPREPAEHRSRMQELKRWLEALDSPVGLFAPHIEDAHDVITACHELEIAVPEEVAVLAETLDHKAELTFPNLSSIDIGSLRIGYEAAKILDALMRGEPVAPGPRLMPPAGVTTRHSTDVLAVENPYVQRALKLIRLRACDGLSVEQMLEEIPVSRRSLELQFRKQVGRTLQQEMLRVRIERIKQLLRETDLNVIEIAARTDFASRSHLNHAFKRSTGLTPTDYRSRHRW